MSKDDVNKTSNNLESSLGRADRLNVVDYSAAWYSTRYGILIPYPQPSIKYVAAVVEPLQFEAKIYFFTLHEKK